jgi:hypothetical protein
VSGVSYRLRLSLSVKIFAVEEDGGSDPEAEPNEHSDTGGISDLMRASCWYQVSLPNGTHGYVPRQSVMK